jgi:hypothetical protein
LFAWHNLKYHYLKGNDMSSFRFVSVLTILIAATWPLVGQTPSTWPAFTFAKGQRVYVVGVESRSRDTSITKASLDLERYAKNAFKRHKVFQLASTLHNADFVFFVMVDDASGSVDEVAVVVTPAAYQQSNGSFDALRNAALWQSDNHFKHAAGHAGLAMATGGLSIIFDHPDVVAGLVKQFHKDAIGK